MDPNESSARLAAIAEELAWRAASFHNFSIPLDPQLIAVIEGNFLDHSTNSSELLKVLLASDYKTQLDSNPRAVLQYYTLVAMTVPDVLKNDPSLKAWEASELKDIQGMIEDMVVAVIDMDEARKKTVSRTQGVEDSPTADHVFEVRREDVLASKRKETDTHDIEESRGKRIRLSFKPRNKFLF